MYVEGNQQITKLEELRAASKEARKALEAAFAAYTDFRD